MQNRSSLLEVAILAKLVFCPFRQLTLGAVASFLCCVLADRSYAVSLAEVQERDEVAEQTTVRGEGEYTSNVQKLNVKSLSETIGLEWQDRINRIRRLSKEHRTPPPEVQEELQLQPGTLSGIGYPVPVIRIVYRDRTFFDSDKDRIREDAHAVLDVIAQTIKRDLPDTQLLVVGHTDSIGTDQYNDDLALRRAANVMRELVQRKVPTQQLATAAMGERQPIATNATEDGRGRNRRVEFMVASFYAANIRLVEERKINLAWLDNHPIPIREKPAILNIIEKMNPVAVYKPTPTIARASSTEHAVRDLEQVGTIKIREPREHALRF